MVRRRVSIHMSARAHGGTDVCHAATGFVVASGAKGFFFSPFGVSVAPKRNRSQAAHFYKQPTRKSPLQMVAELTLRGTLCIMSVTAEQWAE